MAEAFVGRERELADLVVLIEGAIAAGEPAVGIVLGDPGVGKSRLLREAASAMTHARQEAAGFEPEREVSLAAAMPLLRWLGSSPAGGRLESLLFGEGASSGPEQIRVFESAYRALSTMGPTLLVLDDVQWVDPASAALYHYLVRSAHQEGNPLCLLAAARPVPAVRSMLASLPEILAPDRLLEMRLGPLGPEESLRLARRLGLEGEAAAEAVRLAKGSPFWLTDLASAGLGQAEVGQVVTRRLRGSGADASELLAVLAIAGRPLPAAEAAWIAGWDGERFAAAAGELTDAGLVVESSAGLRVTHDLIRAAAERQVPDPVARRIHARIAERLEERGEHDVRELLVAAGHRRASGASALPLIERILASPARGLMGLDGSRQLEEALEGEPGGDRAIRVRTGLAELAGELGDQRAAFDRWSELAAMLPEGSLRARAALEASRAAMELRLPAETAWFLRRARSLAPRGSAVAVEVDAHEATVLRRVEQRVADARPFESRALEQGRELFAASAGGPPVLRAYLAALAVAAEGARLAALPETLLALAEEWEQAARERDHVGALRAAYWSGFAHHVLGHRAEAERRLQGAWQEANRRVLPALALEFGEFLLSARIAWGELSAAAELAEWGADLQRRIGGAFPFESWIHVVRLSTDDWRAAADELGRAIPEQPDPHHRVLPGATLAARLVRLAPPGERAEAVAPLLERTREDGERAGCWGCLGEHLLRGAEAWALLGRPDRARAWLADWEADPAPELHSHRLFHDRASATLATVDGESEGPDALEEVAGRADALGRVFESMWIRLDLGSLVAGRDPDRAAGVLREVGAVAERIGAETERRFAERLLKDLGVRTWRRGPAARGEGLEALSDREREVARLVGAGASNPEIASSLFLSRKTVERHVSNILGKLQLRNRTELAAVVGSGPGRDEGAPR